MAMMLHDTIIDEQDARDPFRKSEPRISFSQRCNTSLSSRSPSALQTRPESLSQSREEAFELITDGYESIDQHVSKLYDRNGWDPIQQPPQQNSVAWRLSNLSVLTTTPASLHRQGSNRRPRTANPTMKTTTVETTVKKADGGDELPEQTPRKTNLHPDVFLISKGPDTLVTRTAGHVAASRVETFKPHPGVSRSHSKRESTRPVMASGRPRHESAQLDALKKDPDFLQDVAAVDAYLQAGPISPRNGTISPTQMLRRITSPKAAHEEAKDSHLRALRQRSQAQAQARTSVRYIRSNEGLTTNSRRREDKQWSQGLGKGPPTRTYRAVSDVGTREHHPSTAPLSPTFEILMPHFRYEDRFHSPARPSPPTPVLSPDCGHESDISTPSASTSTPSLALGGESPPWYRADELDTPPPPPPPLSFSMLQDFLRSPSKGLVTSSSLPKHLSNATSAYTWPDTAHISSVTASPTRTRHPTMLSMSKAEDTRTTRDTTLSRDDFGNTGTMDDDDTTAKMRDRVVRSSKGEVAGTGWLVRSSSQATTTTTTLDGNEVGADGKTSVFKDELLALDYVKWQNKLLEQKLHDVKSANMLM
ncbi:hypothetical protein FA10DRAFT_278080 [Acaromyces ingoldii]|uniref:Uncharacterized protein n=1 Tax=Acaromyces ingoldii TaxID=215250 RepID=A0A316YRB2_9BASI|nr:hypothetical protein FA10DRAFT_278080 [Acaromyces ingoldii]PWN91208.1 hypothetical protein FA10DRAFT_278080 [Acaromyces ingoldii]